jgi:hypothetical protein
VEEQIVDVDVPVAAGGIALLGLILAGQSRGGREMPGLKSDPESDWERRVTAVVRRRVAADRKSHWYGLTTAVSMLVLSALTLRTVVPPSFAYIAAWFLYMMNAFAKQRSRPASGRRAAQIRPRSVVPWYVFVPALPATFVPLVEFSAEPVFAPLTSMMVCGTFLLGLRLADAPAALPGNDPAVEVLDDQRLRVIRAGNLVFWTLMFASWYVVVFRAAVQPLALAAGVYCLLVAVMVRVWLDKAVRKDLEALYTEPGHG